MESYSLIPSTGVETIQCEPLPKGALLDGVLTVQEQRKLQHDLFNDSGMVLSQIREYAHRNSVPAVPFLIACILRVLSSVPPGTSFDAGLGKGSCNLFVVVLGNPGDGKDRLASVASDAVTVCQGTKTITPDVMPVGSGEGIVTSPMPVDGENAHPVLFEVSEVGALTNLMARSGSTLRSTLLQVYSGQALGYNNKNEKQTLPAGCYTAGLWVSAQPDKVGDLVGGKDDGLRHRFLWCDTFDPLTPDTVELRNITLNPVALPQEILNGDPIQFPSAVRYNNIQVRRNRIKGLPLPEGHQGHRNQTRCKVAAGLALLRSSSTVSEGDWKRAGLLMEYSDKIQRYAQQHGVNMRVKNAVENMDALDEAKRQREQRWIQEAEGKIIQTVKEAIEATPPNQRIGVRWSPFRQKARSNKRKSLDQARENLHEKEIITIDNIGTPEQPQVFIRPGNQWATINANP